LLQHPALAGVVFTGSGAVATQISRDLAAREGARLPLIAETGGLNVMIADSSALPEQLVSDVMASAFTSAGQRCSALRVLWLQEDIRDDVLQRLKGALEEWNVDDPGLYATDMGPVIDEASLRQLEAAAVRLSGKSSWSAQGRVNENGKGSYFAPRIFLLARKDLPQEEIFGPVLAITTWKHDELPAVIAWINQSGYGLTLGVHSRIESTLDEVARQAAVGNIYLNRNQIGAVVGCQPFGGEGLSGTGFKAGGPHYLLRFMTERTVTTNLSALGVNTTLIDLDE
jgi:RHH-type proline utilization regulon transcriptional repressor/proline dehydrogenase/delta 1-pyrroline-5-carboxylate dehydrogenase